jgi:hypothetical protein
MTADQEERHASNKLVVQEAEANPQSMNLIPSFAAGIVKLKEINDQVDKLRPLQERDTSGVTVNKNFTLENLRIFTIDIAGAVHSYAYVKKDFVLMKVVNFGKAKVNRMTQEKIISAADTVLSESKKLLPADLEKEGISAAELKEYDEMVTYYRGISTSVRGAIIDTSGYTAAVLALFGESVALFKNSLDKLGNQFERKDHAFYLKYKAARNHIDRGGPSVDTKDKEDTKETDPKA